MNFRPLVLGIVLAMHIGVAAAQETTGTLGGRFRDPQELPLAGVVVTVAGPQGVRQTVTQADGRYRVPFLVPGSYTVRAEGAGFKAFEQSGIVVMLGQLVDVSAVLEMGPIAETVYVTREFSPIGDATRADTGQTLSGDFLATVPLGRTVSEALYVAAGVSGASTGRMNPSISGGSGLDNQYVVDGVNLTNTGYGAFGSYSSVLGSLGTATPF
jgi:hypothetical protein